MATKIVQIIMKIIVGLFIVLIALFLFTIIILPIILGVGSLIYNLTMEKASDYTTEEHLERITEIVREKYINSQNYDYTSFSVYPLYDENEKVNYVLVEFEPQGFYIVQIREKGHGLYLRHHYEETSWTPYTVVREINEKGKEEVIYNFELDENGEMVEYNCSPYKLAGVLNEKLYLLRLSPAVKKDNKFINLISNQEINMIERDSHEEKFLEAGFRSLL